MPFPIAVHILVYSGTGPIHIDDVSCSGFESRLIDCSYATYTAEDSHYEDVGVWCQPGNQSFVLLQNPPLSITYLHIYQPSDRKAIYTDHKAVEKYMNTCQ